MPEKEKIKPSYLGHWDRLRQRFKKAGFEGFHDYEVIEFLLTYVIHAKDTKPYAKALIEKFGSLSNILDARPEKLQEVTGIGPRSALFFKALRETVSEYFKNKAFEGKFFLNISDLVDYLKSQLGGKQNEVVHVLYLDSKNELIHAENLGEGTVSETMAFPRRIVEEALRRNATSVILAHNHPGGLPEPSDTDTSLTSAVQKALETVEIRLQEHIIISDVGYYSYRGSGYFDR